MAINNFTIKANGKQRKKDTREALKGCNECKKNVGKVGKVWTCSECGAIWQK